MNFEKFKESIDYLIEMHKRNREIYRYGVDLLDYNESYDKCITLLWSEILTPEGQDWLWWYMYDKDGISGNPREDIRAWDNEGEEICKNLENLHAYLYKSNYFRRYE